MVKRSKIELMKNKVSQEACYALLTGASHGIGNCLAEELASRNYNLILTALPESNLSAIAAEIKTTYNVEVHHFEIDLSEKSGPEKLYDWCKENNFKIGILINNAGIGHEGPFESTPFSFIDNMMQLNMNAVVHLTYLFLPDLKKCKDAYILNVGSLASFRPIPFKIVYTASKSFVFFFTRALREELLNSSIKVSVLCPGPVFTNDDVKRRTKSKGAIAQRMVMTPRKVARIAIENLFKGKAVIVPGSINKFLLFFEKLVPRNNKIKILGKIYKDSI